MQHPTFNDFARHLADKMIAERFAKDYGIRSFDAYLDLIDRRATAHLDDHMAQRVRDTAGAQRRRARLKIDTTASVLIAIPMNDPHKNETVWAELGLATWFNLIESGADGAWLYDHKGKDRRAGQVRTSVPLRGRIPSKNVTVARLIGNAKPGQQARVLDRNPLNLRAENVYLVGNPKAAEGRVGHAKTDSKALLSRHAAERRSLAGSNYGLYNLNA